MGYYTNYTITAKIPEPDLFETKLVKQLSAFFKVPATKVVEAVTQHPELFYVEGQVTVEELQDRLEDISGYSFTFGQESDSYKWYDNEKDMHRLSTEYPSVEFTVDGDGEESGDIWRMTVKNGVLQKKKAKIVFE